MINYQTWCFCSFHFLRSNIPNNKFHKQWCVLFLHASRLIVPKIWEWSSIKIKINMTCVSKEHDIKTKMEQEQWIQLKMLYLLGYNLKIVIWWGGGDKYLVRGESTGGKMSKFSAGGGPPPIPSSPAGKTLITVLLYFLAIAPAASIGIDLRFSAYLMCLNVQIKQYPKNFYGHH